MIYGSLITVMTQQWGAGVHMWNLPGSVTVQFLYVSYTPRSRYAGSLTHSLSLTISPRSYMVLSS